MKKPKIIVSHFRADKSLAAVYIYPHRHGLQVHKIISQSQLEQAYESGRFDIQGVKAA